MAGTKKDPVENIRNLYEQDSRPIPYPVFMKCFDALLEDPPDPQPATPSEDLKPYLRAVCMAFDLGIADQQDRESARKDEFDEYIFPAWEKYLPAAEMKAIRELLSGKVRKRMERMRREEQKQEAEEHRQEFEEMSGAATRGRQNRFAQAMKSALHEARESETSSDKTTSPGETDNERDVLGDENKIPVAEDISKLLKAIKAGKIPIDYNEPKDRTPLAKYQAHGQLVTVLLIQKEGDYFCLVEADHPDKTTPGAREALETIADEMSYEKRHPFSYERTIGGASLKMQLGNKGIYLICRRPRQLEDDEVVQTIQHLHKRFIRFLNRLNKQSAEPDND